MSEKQDEGAIFNTDAKIMKAKRDTMKTEREAMKTERETMKTERETMKTERETMKTERETMKTEGDTMKSKEVYKANKARSNWNRKTAGLLVAAALVFALAGCGRASNEKDAPGSEANSSEGQTGNESLTGEMYLFGKISEVVGNEVTIQLAKMPEMDEPPVQESGSDEDLPMGEMPAMSLVPAQPAGSVDAGGGIDMEFTGDSVKVNVPAGLDIRDAADQPVTVSSLAKGNVIQFSVDNMDDLTLKSILIME